MTQSLKTITDLKKLRVITAARIGLTRAGSSLSTHEILSFDLDHARARDAVHLPFNATEITTALKTRGLEALQVQSAAAERTIYLQRPDLGRQLDESSKQQLNNIQSQNSLEFDLAIVIADGLSAKAIHSNAIAFFDEFLSLLPAHGWKLAPVTVASQARVALADEIGAALNSRLSIILIGERPGLTAADSMGIYITYAPQKGRTDAERNCISNIHQGGLSHKEAALQLEELIIAAFQLQLTGLPLKKKLKSIL
ncbi:MAG: ethanolamine ammonia-lyase subunit EutC [Deltaproteobacteria bacterium]|nr:ethanolamine ammonia-lyase subunit EutC [Deltaproteobacteria bacterium]MCW8893968.1 ethanolamine ammonia-lyase subunit EutC [Deltaproteobacteria bacterium]